MIRIRMFSKTGSGSRAAFLAFAAAFAVLATGSIPCAAADNSSSVSGTKLAGSYICFEGDESPRAVLKQGILELQDGLIRSITEYAENVPDVIYLDPDCVILPGLIDLHSHADYNSMQLWISEEADAPWDNRFEWRASAQYKEDVKDPFQRLFDQWSDPLSEEDSEVCMGDLLSYFTELQAAAGGTTLLQTPVGTDEEYDFSDSHEKLRLIRGTGTAEDLERTQVDAVQSLTQIYIPDKEMGPEDPSSYLPVQDTSSWSITHAVRSSTGEDRLEELLNGIAQKTSCGYLIHLAEGRAGMLAASQDVYSRHEFETFMADIEEGVSQGRFTEEDVKNAHIGLIHACAVDLKNETDRAFLEKYGIGLIWSPVSNLLLYADTPDFYQYLDEPGLRIALGSDWSPSGSKTVWDESRFAYGLIQGFDAEEENTRENLLKACTVVPAGILGEKRLGNIQEGSFADLFILHSGTESTLDLDTVLETFVTADEDAVEGVIVRGRAVYGMKTFLDALPEDETVYYGSIESDQKEQDRLFLIPDLFKGQDLGKLYEEYKDILESVEIEMSEVRTPEDPYYLEVLGELGK